MALRPNQRKVRDGEDTVANTRGRVRSPDSHQRANVYCNAFLFSWPPHSISSNPNHCSDAAIDIRIGGGPAGDADAHGGAALPDSYAAPASAFVLKLFDDALGLLGVAERNEDLVED